MNHMTLGRLRRIVEHMSGAPDEVEVRFYLEHEDDLDDTFGRVRGWINAGKEDDSPAYLGFRIADTGDLS